MATLIPQLGTTALYIDIAIAIIVISIFLIFLVKNRQNVKMERMAFPLLYAYLYRGQFGIESLKKFSKKHKEGIKLFGYISIGIGFIGMILAIVMVGYLIYSIIFKPTTAAAAPFLPFVNIPVLGYISFSHWIITIFLIILIHEAAHAIVVLAHGLKLKNTGFGLFAIFVPFIPGAFVEPDEKEIEKQSDVVQYSIAAAGPVSNFILLIPLLLIAAFIIAPIENNITYTDGIAFDTVQNETLPAYIAQIPNGTAFNLVNGKNLSTALDLQRELYNQGPNREIQLAHINQTTNQLDYEYNVTTQVSPYDKTAGYLGVTNLHDNVKIKDSASSYAGIFSWFKGLITLLVNITLSLGIINLFPASITDGGRMFSTALNKISPNKEKNKKIIATLALIFLAIILFSFVTYFTGNPFSLLHK